MDSEYKNILVHNIDKIHTTELGYKRISNNLKINDFNIKYIIDKILDQNSIIYKKGKNFYVEIDNIKITINSYNYCVITAHRHML